MSSARWQNSNSQHLKLLFLELAERASKTTLLIFQFNDQILINQAHINLIAIRNL